MQKVACLSVEKQAALTAFHSNVSNGNLSLSYLSKSNMGIIYYL